MKMLRFTFLAVLLLPAIALAQGDVEPSLKTDAQGNLLRPLNLGGPNVVGVLKDPRIVSAYTATQTMPVKSTSLIGNYLQDATAAIDGAIAQLTAGPATEAIFSSANDATGVYVRNTAAWFKGVDLTSISAWCSAGYNTAANSYWHLTVIAPGYAVSAAHVGDLAGQTARFVDNNNVTYTVTVGAESGIAGDLVVYPISPALPASITPAQVMPATLPTGFTFVGCPVFYTNQLRNGNVGEVVSLAGNADIIQGATAANRVPWTTFYTSSPLIVGDSTSPYGLFLGGKFVLLGTAFQVNGAAPDVGAAAAAINSILAASGETLTVANMPAYPLGSFTVGSVTTSGTNGSVTNSGSGVNPVLNFNFPVPTVAAAGLPGSAGTASGSGSAGVGGSTAPLFDVVSGNGGNSSSSGNGGAGGPANGPYAYQLTGGNGGNSSGTGNGGNGATEAGSAQVLYLALGNGGSTSSAGNGGNGGPLGRAITYVSLGNGGAGGTVSGANGGAGGSANASNPYTGGIEAYFTGAGGAGGTASGAIGGAGGSLNGVVFASGGSGGSGGAYPGGAGGSVTGLVSAAAGNGGAGTGTSAGGAGGNTGSFVSNGGNGSTNGFSGGNGGSFTSNGTAASPTTAGVNGGSINLTPGVNTITSGGGGTLTQSPTNFTGLVGLKGYTVAALNALPAGTFVAGSTAYVTDAVSPTYLGTLTGGGSTVTPAFYTGAAWVAH